MFFDPEMIGAIKIKDGLFIGDELASTVSEFYFIVVGPRVRCCKQSHPYNQLRGKADTKPLGVNWSIIPHLLLARSGQPGKLQILNFFRCCLIQEMKQRTQYSNSSKKL